MVYHERGLCFVDGGWVDERERERDGRPRRAEEGEVRPTRCMPAGSEVLALMSPLARPSHPPVRCRPLRRAPTLAAYVHVHTVDRSPETGEHPFPINHIVSHPAQIVPKYPW